MDIKSLKDKILQLAIQGKLVPQNESDEPASVLLEKIKAEKEQLIKDKIIKKEKILQNITEEEKDFDLPKGWEWCRLCDITHSLTLNDGDWILSKDMNERGLVKLIQLGSIGDGKYIDKGFKNITEDTFLDLKCREIEEGDILINRLLGKKMLACILPKIEGKKITSVDTCFIKPNSSIYNEKFILYLVLSKYFQHKVYDRVAGTTRQRISKGNLITISFPLPPLEEQKRIVDKVDELFKLIDELDNNKQDLLENIANTRNKILQLAIQGKLVEQCEDDEPASVLLEKIKAEKERLIKNKIIKKEKPLPEISAEEKRFELPKGWEWCRLGEIIALSDNLNIQSKLKSDEMINYLDIDSIDNIQQKVKGTKLEPVKKLSSRARRVLKKNMIVYSMVRPYLKNMAIITEDKENFIGSTGFVAFKSIIVEKEYIFNYLRSEYVTNKLNSYTIGFNSPSINLTQFTELEIPVPPLEEQKRIVAKMDLIMDYLDKLQQDIESQEIILENIIQ